MMARFMAQMICTFMGILCAFFIQSSSVSAQNLTGSLGQLPVVAESNDKGILVDYLKAMQRAYPEGTISFEVLPFKRSLEDAISGKTDFHAPILKAPHKSEKELGFRYSDANVWSVIFVLYTNRSNKKINVGNLDQFNIETDGGHVGFFDFPIHPSSCIECSLKKVETGRIDGYIFAGLESDEVVKKNKLENIKSVAYHTYEGKFVLPLGEKGKVTNALLSKIIERTKKNGDYQKILGRIINYYKNWKPVQ